MYVVLSWLIGGGSLPLRCNPTSSSDGPGRVKPKGRRNTRSKDHKSGLRSKDTIDVIQQTQKDDCEGTYVPTKTGIYTAICCVPGWLGGIFMPQTPTLLVVENGLYIYSSATKSSLNLVMHVESLSAFVLHVWYFDGR